MYEAAEEEEEEEEDEEDEARDLEVDDDDESGMDDDDGTAGYNGGSGGARRGPTCAPQPATHVVLGRLEAIHGSGCNVHTQSACIWTMHAICAWVVRLCELASCPSCSLRRL